MMKIIARSEWGAQPARGTVGAMGQATHFFVHHSVTSSPPSDVKPAEEESAMRLLQQIAFGRKFLDISYSFAVFASGRVYEGRGWRKQGAHTENFNSTAYAIVCVGNYDQQQPTDAQIRAIADVYKLGVAEGVIRPGAPIFAHRQVKATACPGQLVFAKMGEIRALAAGASSGTNTRGPRPILMKGDQGVWVEKAQRKLNQHGASLVVDGAFGPATEAAVAQFQKANAIAIDGVIGPATWKVLMTRKAKKAARGASRPGAAASA